MGVTMNYVGYGNGNIHDQDNASQLSIALTIRTAPPFGPLDANFFAGKFFNVGGSPAGNSQFHLTRFGSEVVLTILSHGAGGPTMQRHTSSSPISLVSPTLYRIIVLWQSPTSVDFFVNGTTALPTTVGPADNGFTPVGLPPTGAFAELRIGQSQAFGLWTPVNGCYGDFGMWTERLSAGDIFAYMSGFGLRNRTSGGVVYSTLEDLDQINDIFHGHEAHIVVGGSGGSCALPPIIVPPPTSGAVTTKRDCGQALIMNPCLQGCR